MTYFPEDHRFSLLCYEGEGTGEGEGGEGDGGEGGEGAGGDSTRTFTQAELNKILADDKRKHQSKFEKLESNLAALGEDKTLSEQEKERLAKEVDDLRKSLRTRETQAEVDRKKAEEKYSSDLASQTERANYWEGLFKQEAVSRSLQDAATTADAYNPNQIVGLLKPYTELKDVEGKLTPMIDFPDIDEKTGEEITTLRTPSDAVKRMRELPKMYGNLFKSNVVSGVGAGQGASAGADKIDPSTMTSEEYRKLRKEAPEKLGLPQRRNARR